ncbi:MAG: hypothetical protein LC674_01440 [Actinobacteria bacterium]|nr:hypothetical protein [Actinomycetota bacterium]
MLAVLTLVTGRCHTTHVGQTTTKEPRMSPNLLRNLLFTRFCGEGDPRPPYNVLRGWVRRAASEPNLVFVGYFDDTYRG